MRLIDGDFFRHPVDQIAAFDGDAFADTIGRSHGHAVILLDPLCRGFADQQVVMTADIGNDGLVHLVTAGANRSGIGQAA